MVAVWSFYFQRIQAVDREIIYRKTVEIRYCAVKDVCQGILCDRVDFFAVVYFYVAVTACFITDIDSDFFVDCDCLCLFFLGIVLCVRRIRILCIAVR